jgi:hypothetical protein
MWKKSKNVSRSTSRRHISSVEPLESRRLLATLVNPTTVTYQDVDGDTVTVALSKSVLNAGNVNTIFNFNTGSVNGDNSAPQQLQFLDLSSLTAASFGGGNITITAKRSNNGGDGLVNVGYINGGALNLGAVSVHGDLGGIDAGDGSSATAGLKSLSVQSLGRLGISTQAPVGNLVSGIDGQLGTLTVASDIDGEFINVFGPGGMSPILGSIGTVNIGGSLIGGSDDYRGEIETGGNIGAVTIKGSIVGGGGQYSGAIESGGTIKSVTVGGSLIGGSGDNSGQIFSQNNMGAVKIGGDVQGGNGGDSGEINSHGAITSIAIGGSFVGSATNSTEENAIIGCTLNLGQVTITGSVIGGLSGSSAVIACLANITGITIGGSLIGGAGVQSGEIQMLVNPGSLGPVKIGHDLRAGSGGDSGNILLGDGVNLTSVTIGGSLIGGALEKSGYISTSTGNIGPVTVTGSVQGGAGDNSGSIQSGGTLGNVTIGGSLIGGSHLASGLVQSALAMGAVKIGHDLLGGTGEESGAIDGKSLTSVTIGGSIVGSADTTNTNAEIVSEAGGNISAVTVTGDIKGGKAQQSGVILCGGNLGNVNIGGSLIGGGAQTTGYVHSTGNMGAVTVGLNVQGGDLADSGEINSGGSLTSAKVGGSLTGGAGQFGGSLLSAGNMGAVTVGGDVQGGSANDTADINSSGTLGKVNVGGSVIGGNGARSAQIFAATSIDAITITGDIRGGNVAANAGRIFSTGPLTSVTVNGSLIGGAKDGTGEIKSNMAIGAVKIAGSIVGGNDPINSTIDESGYIQGLRIASVSVGRSIIAGQNPNADTTTYFLKRSGSVRAANDIGAITVGGSIVGNITNPAVISARGQATPKAPSDIAIASLTVGGKVENANILAGYDIDLNPVSDDAQIGDVKVGIDWVASNLLAGTYFNSVDQLFERIDDLNDNPNIRSSIGNITIGGQVLGTPASLNPLDNFGFVAEQIKSFSVGGTKFTLNSGPLNDDLPVGATGDVVVFEELPD